MWNQATLTWKIDRGATLNNIIINGALIRVYCVNICQIGVLQYEFVCREEYLAKIEKRIKTYDFQILNEPRPDKLLLVLDVDYTLFGELFVCVWIVLHFFSSLMLMFRSPHVHGKTCLWMSHSLSRCPHSTSDWRPISVFEVISRIFWIFNWPSWTLADLHWT